MKPDDLREITHYDNRVFGMPFLEPKPDPFRRGDKFPGANDLNMIVQAVMRQLRGGLNTNVKDFGDRVTIGSSQVEPQLPSASNYTMQFTVLQELADSLICGVFTQPAGNAGWIPQPYFQGLQLNDQITYQVAKPYYLQQTPWNNMLAGVNDPAVGIIYDSIGFRTLYSIVGPSITLVPSFAAGGVLPTQTTVLYIVFALSPFDGSQIAVSNIAGAFIQAPNQTINLVWTNIPGVVRYDIYRSFGSNLVSNFIYIGTAGVNNFTDPGGQTGPLLVYTSNTRTKQQIYPAYIPGEPILATRTWTGVTDANGNSVVWMDANAAGRTWETITPFVPHPCGIPGPPPLLYVQVNKAVIGVAGLESIPIYADTEEDGLTTWTGGGVIYDDTIPGAGAMIGTIWLRFWPLADTYALDVWANGVLSTWEADAGFTCNPLTWAKAGIAVVIQTVPFDLATDPIFALIELIVAQQIAAELPSIQAYINTQIPIAIAAYFASFSPFTGQVGYTDQFGNTTHLLNFNNGLFTGVT